MRKECQGGIGMRKNDEGGKRIEDQRTESKEDARI